MDEMIRQLTEQKQEPLRALPAKLAETELKGGNVNYYLVDVEFPQRENQSPYQAECDDIADALELTPDEKDIFKEIWRSANARLHNGKPGHKAVYGAEKIVHRAERILRKARRLSK